MLAPRLALTLALVACSSRTTPAPRPDAEAIATAPPDAGPACGGKPPDCAACASGDGAACARVATDTPADRDKVPWYRRACDLGDPGGCEGLSWAATFVVHDHQLFERATARERALRAEEHARAAARCGKHDDEACLKVAIDLAIGRVVEKDVGAAVALLDEGCGRHVLPACSELAHLEELGPADRIRYARRACAAGEQRTCGDFVGLFREPPLAPREQVFARATLARMCAARDATACWVLSGLYWTGKGGGRDHAHAGKLIARACMLDHTLCDVLERWKRGEGFFIDLGSIPTLDLRPLVDQPRRR